MLLGYFGLFRCGTEGFGEGQHLEDEADGEEDLERDGRCHWMGPLAKERPKSSQ